MAACPHCGTTVRETPQLSGRVVKCPRCQQPFQMPDLAPPGPAVNAAPMGYAAPPPQVNAYAPPAPPQESVPDFSAPSVSTGASSFRPRTYPAINLLITVLYIIAGLIALGFCIAEILIIVGGASMMRMQRGAEGGLVGLLTLTLFNLVYCGLGILYSVAMAEMLRLFMDIQSNTHETAYWSRRAVKD